MSYKYYVADVFTDQIFSGAQVAVFPSADGLNDQLMADIARELNLSETVFLFKQHDIENKWKMRVFSPISEIDRTGHPVVAAAFVLSSCGDLKLLEKNTSLVFEQNTSSVIANVSGLEGKPSLIQYTRQATPTIDYFTPTDSEMAKILSVSETEIDNKKYSTRLVSCGLPYLIVPVYYYETLRKAQFNFSAWSQSSAPQTAAQEILLISPKTPNKDSNFALRLLGPNIGLHQDPPVGSTMASFASYLCSFDFMRKGTYSYVVERGDNELRRSVLHLELDHKREDTLTLRVAGEAVMVAEATLFLSK